MNKSRRAELAKAVAILNELTDKVADALAIIESCADEEREYYDNMPESLQQGEKGERADSAASILEEIQSDLENFDIENMISRIEEASE